MPATDVRAFRDADNDGDVPILEWLGLLERRNRKAYRKCLARILELSDRGNEMRRPHADYLEEGIYELRAKEGKVNYRILYFFFDKHAVVLSHGITKERNVPRDEIERAVERMGLVMRARDKYTADFDT